MPLTYVIADLHGRFDLLQEALAIIAQHASNRDFKIVTLGDYVDRGPQSRQVVGCLMAAQAAGANLICLKGNHEYMMHRALTLSWFASASRARCLDWWKHNGGDFTLASYGNKVPSNHLRWMKNLPTMHVNEHRIFVHAGVDPAKPLDEQTDEFLLWHRYPEEADIGYGERHVVHGHAPNPHGPEELSHRTNLDTLAWKTGRLVIAVFYSTITRRVRRPRTSNCPVHTRPRRKRHTGAISPDAKWFRTSWLEPSRSCPPWTTEKNTIPFAISIS